MSGPSDNTPRWQPPTESEEVPRWEPPPASSGGPSAEVPRWDPTATGPSPDVPRWEPDRDVSRWEADRGAGARFDTGIETTRRGPERTVSPFALPFVWWGAHPWVFAWVFVFLAPGAVLLLRLVDESGYQGLVQPLAWLMGALFALALVLAALASSKRSVTRLALGVVTSLVALGVLLWPVTRVTMGHTPCPARAGTDLGTPVSTTALQAWLNGDVADAGWKSGTADASWRDAVKAAALLEYAHVESGCWERIAPIDGSRTWHEFRVTIQEGDRTPLSKIVIVHTALRGDAWKITAIEGPLP